MNKQRIAILGAAGLGIIGSILPWVSVSFGRLSKSLGGMDAGGGVIILLMGVAGVLAFLGNKTETIKGWKFWTVFGTSLLTALIGIIKISDVSQAAAQLGRAAKASAGIGLILITIAGVAAVACAFIFKKDNA